MSNWRVLYFEVHCHDRHCMDWVRPGTQLTQMEHENCVTGTKGEVQSDTILKEMKADKGHHSQYI